MPDVIARPRSLLQHRPNAVGRARIMTSPIQAQFSSAFVRVGHAWSWNERVHTTSKARCSISNGDYPCTFRLRHEQAKTRYASVDPGELTPRPLTYSSIV